MRTGVAGLPDAELAAFARRARERYDAFKARGLALDLTRGKPGPDQLDLAGVLAELPGRDGWRAADGSDCRNHGGARGLPELRALFAPVLGAPPGQVVAAGNSSLALEGEALLGRGHPRVADQHRRALPSVARTVAGRGLPARERCTG